MPQSNSHCTIENSIAARLDEGPLQLVLKLLTPTSRGALFHADTQDRYAVFTSFPTVIVLSANDSDVAMICGGVRGPLRPMPWDHLTALTLEADYMSQAAVTALVKAPLPSLAILRLGRVPLQPNHAWHLADNFAARLLRLELCSIRLTSSCLAKITQNHVMPWPVLEMLKVDGCTLDGPHMKQLLPVLFPKLWTLALSFCNITHKAVAAFTVTNWSLLRTICLSGNSLSFYDVHQLSQANLPALRQLYLANTSMSAPCVAHLVNGHWPLLHTWSMATGHCCIES